MGLGGKALRRVQADYRRLPMIGIQLNAHGYNSSRSTPDCAVPKTFYKWLLEREKESSEFWGF
jgi:hypothetical protein